MNMAKQLILPVLVVAVVIAAVAGGYYYFFKEQLDQYSKDEATSERLKQRLEQFVTAFSGIQPQIVVDEWTKAVGPWSDALKARAVLFSTGDLFKVEEVPEKEIPRFYYEKQYNEKINKLQMEAYQRGIAIPATTFDTPNPSGLAMQTVPKERVAQWLQMIDFGAAMIRLLMDAKAVSILRVVPWQETAGAGVVRMKSTTLVFTMTMQNLGNFLEKLSRDKRFYSVNTLKISNPLLRSYQDPPLQVEMIVTTAVLIEGVAIAAPATPTATPAAGPAAVATAATGMPVVPVLGGASSPQADLADMREAQKKAAARAKKPAPSFWRRLWPF